MTGLSILGSRLTGTLTTPDDTAGVDAFNSTIRHRPDAVVRPASAADVVETGRFARAEGRLNPRVREDATSNPTHLGTTRGAMSDRFHHPTAR
jgi:hypothetical protein